MKKKIFLAEDDVDDQEILSEIIQEIAQDIQLVLAENGEDLIKKLDKCSDAELPNLIVLDQNMPRLKGKDTVELLRTMPRYASIPAVIYSTYHDSNFVTSCEQLGIELLLKPDTFDEFRSMMEEMINRRIA